MTTTTDALIDDIDGDDDDDDLVEDIDDAKTAQPEVLDPRPGLTNCCLILRLERGNA